MKTITDRIRKLTYNQVMLIMSIVLIWNGYLFMGWYGDFLRNGGNVWAGVWFLIPVILVFVFGFYKDYVGWKDARS